MVRIEGDFGFFRSLLLNPKPSNVAVGVLNTASIDVVSHAWSNFHPRECRAARVRARALVSGVRARPRADLARIVTPIVAIVARIRLGPLPLLRPHSTLGLHTQIEQSYTEGIFNNSNGCKLDGVCIAPFQQRMRRIQAYPRKTFKLRVPGNHRPCMRSDLSVKLEQKLERCFRQISRR